MGRRYRLVTRLEEGALAELYKGTAEGPGAPEVLIKLFMPKVSDPAYAKALAEISARTHALGNPSAQAFDEVGLVEGRIAAVRPFIDGYNLGDGLRRLTSKEVVLPPALALYIVAEAAQVVSSAHNKNWIHGAITPGNVLLGKDGKIRVVDFGALEAMNASPALAAIAAKGRHAYRAPEQKTPGSGGPAADVYSLGAITYELITLREVAALRGGGLSTKRDALAPPSRVDRRLNARMDPVIMRALDHAATRRYHSASDLSEALRGLFSVLGYAPGPAELLRFVRDLFPNEVTLGGIGGELPFKGEFTVAEIAPGLLVPRTDFSGAALSDRVSFTSSEIPVVQVPERKAPQPNLAVHPTALDSLPAVAVAPAPAAGPKPANTLEDWEAPPGAMPEAKKLARSGPRRRVPAAQAAPGGLAALATGPVGTPPDPIAAAEEARETREVPRSDDSVPDAPFDPRDLNPKQKTPADWHLPPEPPQPPPRKPKVGIQVWFVAIVACVAMAMLVYLGVGRRVGLATASDVASYRPEDLAAKPIDGPRPDRPEPRGPVAPKPPPPPKAPPGRLTLESDAPAGVLVDGLDIKKATPLVGYEIPPGVHTVLLVHSQTGVMREFNVIIKSGEELKRSESFAKPAPKPGPAPAPAPKAKATKTAPKKAKGPR